MKRARVANLDFRGRGWLTLDEGGRIGPLPKSIPGDVLAVETSLDGYRPQITRWDLLEPSPDRVPDPGCPQDAHCPGCQWRSMRLDAQRAQRQRAWHQAIERLSGVALSDSLWRPCVPSPLSDHYRSRAVARWLPLPDGSHTLGMVPLRALDPDAPPNLPIDLSRCPAQTPRARALLSLAAASLSSAGAIPYHPDLPDTRDGVYFIAVDAPIDVGPARLTLISPSDAPSPALSAAASLIAAADPSISIWFGSISLRDPVFPTRDLLHLAGPPHLLLPSPSLPSPLRASPGSWTPAAPALAATVAQTLLSSLSDSPNTPLLEFGCGIGTHSFALLLSPSPPPLFIGVDSSRPAILDAQHNAQTLGLLPPSVQFRVGIADRAARRLIIARTHTPRVILHGMRLPFGPRLCQALPPLGATHLWYLSPSAFALAEDLPHLTAARFSLSSLTPLDTMPHTYHMMILATFTRSP